MKCLFVTVAIMCFFGMSRHYYVSAFLDSDLERNTRGLNCSLFKLPENELKPLIEKGWALINGRESMFKEFRFPSFSEVSSFAGISRPERYDNYNRPRCVASSDLYKANK